MLGVTVLILVISVMTGFDRELRQKVIDFDAHILVSTEDVLRDWRTLETKIDKTLGERLKRRSTRRRAWWQPRLIFRVR